MWTMMTSEEKNFSFLCQGRLFHDTMPLINSIIGKDSMPARRKPDNEKKLALGLHHPPGGADGRALE
jgi:hypothetical protein